MNRCLASITRPLAAGRQIFLAALLLTLSLSGAAQGFERNFPQAALRGTLVIHNPPEITLNGKADRLSPGARIRNPQNMMVLSGAIMGQELVVNYTREAAGMVHEVWILTPEEARQKRATSPPAAPLQ